EIVARDFLLKDNPDIVINVVDATNIERNLYLTTQLLEMGTKVVLGLNMMDEAKAKAIEIDMDRLSKKLGIPIVATVASKRKGLEELLKKATDYFNKEQKITKIDYGKDIQDEIMNIEGLLKGSNYDYPEDWIAMKLLEGDENIYDHIKEHSSNSINGELNRIKDLSSTYEFEIIDKRYSFINNITKSSISKSTSEEESLTDKIDKVVTHKFWGLPI